MGGGGGGGGGGGAGLVDQQDAQVAQARAMVLAAAPLTGLAAAARAAAAAATGAGAAAGASASLAGHPAFEDAASLMQRGLITLEIMEGGESPTLAPVVASLASLHAAAGDPRGEARALWRRVVELLETSAGGGGYPAYSISSSSFAAATLHASDAAPTWERARARLNLAAADAAAGDAAAAEGEIRAALNTLLSQSGNGSGSGNSSHAATAASPPPGFLTALAIPAQAALAALLLKNATAARGEGAAAAAGGPTREDQEALAAYATLLGAQRAALGVHHPLVADTLGKLGNLHRAAGRHEAAHSLYTRALTLKERGVGGAAGVALGETLTNLAGTFAELAGARQGRMEHGEALAMLERAHAIRIRAAGADDAEASFFGAMRYIHTPRTAARINHPPHHSN